LEEDEDEDAGGEGSTAFTGPAIIATPPPPSLCPIPVNGVAIPILNQIVRIRNSKETLDLHESSLSLSLSPPSIAREHHESSLSLCWLLFLSPLPQVRLFSNYLICWGGGEIKGKKGERLCNRQ